MRFCSNEQDKSEIISDIFIDDEIENKFIIRYLDDTERVFYNLNESIKELEELMIKQAKERDSLEYVDLHIKKYGSIIVSLLSCGLGLKSIFYGNILLCLFSEIIFSKYLYDFVSNCKKINELKKYRLLLENYDGLKEKYGDKSIDIFDVDIYSLREVNKLTKSLKRWGD